MPLDLVDNRNDIDSALTVSKFARIKDYIAGGTISAGEHVTYDTSQTGEDRANYVVQGGAGTHFVGIVLEDCVSGDKVRVSEDGYMEGARTDGTATAGALLMTGASGELTILTATGTAVCVSLAADTGGAGAENVPIVMTR